jgi:hypothetical protein
VAANATVSIDVSCICLIVHPLKQGFVEESGEVGECTLDSAMVSLIGATQIVA